MANFPSETWSFEAGRSTFVFYHLPRIVLVGNCKHPPFTLAWLLWPFGLELLLSRQSHGRGCSGLVSLYRKCTLLYLQFIGISLQNHTCYINLFHITGFSDLNKAFDSFYSIVCCFCSFCCILPLPDLLLMSVDLLLLVNVILIRWPDSFVTWKTRVTKKTAIWTSTSTKNNSLVMNGCFTYNN